MTGLETNATATPLGIDDATPQLRWRLESDQRASRRRQATASSWRRRRRGPPRARATCGTRARSPRRPIRRVRGPALASRTRYFWSVRTSRGPEWAAADLVRDRLSEPERVEGRLDLRAARAPSARSRSRRRRPTTPAACRATRPCSRPLLPATASCASRTWPGSAPGRRVTRARPETATIETVGTAPGNTTAVLAPRGRRHEPQGRVGHELRGRSAADDRHARR